MLANISQRCEFNYGAMGRVGFLYDSMKDQIRWSNLSVKSYISIVSQIGKVLSLSDKDFDRYKIENTKMSDTAISNVFLKAFGDGK